MLYILQIVVRFITWALVLSLGMCILGSHISPTWFPYSSLMSLLFPYLYLVLCFWAVVVLVIRWKLIILVGTMLFLGYSQFSYFLILPSSGEKENTLNTENSVRVLSWNVGSFSPKASSHKHTEDIKRAFFDIINTVSPDIICLQEVWISRKDNWLKNRSKKQGYKFIRYGMFGSFGEDIYHGSVILSKYPLDKNSSQDAFASSLRNHLVQSNIITPKGIINVLSIHFQSNLINRELLSKFKEIPNTQDGKEVAISFSEKINANSRIRSSQINEVINLCKTIEQPIIICADLNEVAGSYNYSSIKDDRLDAFLERGSGFRSTFLNGIASLGIDYIFVDKTLRVNKYEQVEETISDHLAHYTDID